jgi:NAD(P)-dependent dehydrogenase (short-subunit alcohol dehydrogenase family)
MNVEVARRVAVVTGGASGMGRASAEALAGEGVQVAILDVNVETARVVVNNLPKVHGAHMAVGADVTQREQVARAMRQVTGKIGPPTILVNSAGILRATRFLEIDDEEWAAVIGVSMNGSFLCAQACLEAMISAGFGRIVNFSSLAGKSVSTLGGAHYTAAKAGVLGLTRALAKETAAFGVTVNAVCPGLVDTDMVRANCSPAELARYAASFPVARLGQATEVASLVVYLCSDAASYITGAAIDINGGDLMV